MSLPSVPTEALETPKILKKVASAHRYLAELKGTVGSIPNESMIINTLTLQEAKDSSEIENIITTHDELYKSTLFGEFTKNAAAKEVQNYAEALKRGFELIRHTGIIRITDILEIQQILEQNQAGFRVLPGTVLKNELTEKIIYTPPQEAQEVADLMANLAEYINVPELQKIDPLIKMAVIHHQFESIHPFYDGNGRTGRILNILFLVAQGLLNLPVLYLSRYITLNKPEYYRLLQSVRENNEWEQWVLYMLDGVESTAQQTIALINNIKTLMNDYKHRIRSSLPKIYSQDLLNNLFRHPYTKIAFIEQDLGVTRLTASRYLEQLVKQGFLVKEKIGRNNYYINVPLFNLLLGVESGG
ncbi:MAG: Fic family protein [Porticoccaceae bacterium]|nr:Fic family protein [Porticoccaceae bacterium]